MKRLLLSTALPIVFGALYFGTLQPADADVVYTLNDSNDFGTSGAGPFAQVAIHFIDSTHATATFNRLGTYVFGEMGLDINASTFSITGLSFILAPSSNKIPDYSISLGGKVGGIGNFALDYVDNPNGFSDAVTQASFNIQNTSGTWANQSSVLTSTVPEAAAHAFTSTGGSFFASGGPTCTVGCSPPPPPPPPPPIPEPSSLLLLGAGLVGLGAVARRQTRLR